MSIVSELELPEWSQCEQTTERGSPDVVIRVEPLDRDGFAQSGQLPSITATEYWLSVPKVGHFHALDGREIHLKLLPTAEPAKVRPWLFGPVWGALCYQRGLFLIHASAVRIDNEAILFCGGAGRGKSTLAAQLGDRGYALVSDDLCRLDLPEVGPPLVYPSPPRMKLWSDALGELGWTGRELARDHLREGKFHLSLAGVDLFQRLPVREAYMLAWGEFGARDLHGMAAFRAFLSGATYRMELLESMGQIGAHTRRCMEFLRHVPLAKLTRPRDFQASARTLDFLARKSSRAAV